MLGGCEIGRGDLYIELSLYLCSYHMVLAVHIHININNFSARVHGMEPTASALTRDHPMTIIATSKVLYSIITYLDTNYPIQSYFSPKMGHVSYWQQKRRWNSWNQPWARHPRMDQSRL